MDAGRRSKARMRHVKKAEMLKTETLQVSSFKFQVFSLSGFQLFLPWICAVLTIVTLSAGPGLLKKLFGCS